MKTNLMGFVCVLFTVFFSLRSWAGEQRFLLRPSGHGEVKTGVGTRDVPTSSSSSQGLKEGALGVDDCMSAEPKPLELVRVAWEFSGLEKKKESSLMSRVRISGFLPKLSGGLSYDLGDRWDYKYEPGEPRVDQLHKDNGLGWDVGISLDLARTVYQAEQLAILRESSRRAQERRDLALEVIRLVYARRQLMLRGIAPLGSSERSQLDEYTALLDAWTGGVFTDRWCNKGVSR